MSITQPIEEIDQFIDSDGRVYVSSKISDDLEPWFEDMISRYGLEKLIYMFPYVTLVLDNNTGFLKPWKPCSYNARVTNAFHIKWAKEKNNMALESEYGLSLSKYYPKEDEPVIRDIGINVSRIIMNKNELFSPNYDSMPEIIRIDPMPKNWHPNRDSNGNYLSYLNYVQRPYQYNNIPKYSSYLPNYRTFTSYPI